MIKVKMVKTNSNVLSQHKSCRGCRRAIKEGVVALRFVVNNREVAVCQRCALNFAKQLEQTVKTAAAYEGGTKHEPKLAVSGDVNMFEQEY